MEKARIPLIQALQDHRRKQPYSYHVPGHKNGSFFHPSLKDDFQGALGYDVTELIGLDDLHAPEGPIKEAQEATSRLYGTRESFFLVGGTTVGNLAMLYALFSRGDMVFIQRNSHKSVFHAAEIAGVQPILIGPEYDEGTGHAVGLTAAALEDALAHYPEGKGLVLTYPNYFGVSLAIEPVLEVAKKAGLLVIVDEAHGAHFCLGEPFPPPALTAGADAVVQSAHKMLPALTMSSYLHLNGTLTQAQRGNVKEALAMFQSSSPSYLLLASLDGARAYLEELDANGIRSILDEVDQLKRRLAKIEQIKIVNWPEERYHFDPLKVTIKSNTNLTGYQLQELFYQTGLYPEMADERHVLLTIGLGWGAAPRQALDQLHELLRPHELVPEIKQLPIDISRVTRLHAFAGELAHLPKKRVRLQEASGKIAAETIIPYPPGIPLVIKGETITDRAMESIRRLQQAGATFQGSHPELESVLVTELEERQ